MGTSTRSWRSPDGSGVRSIGEIIDEGVRGFFVKLTETRKLAPNAIRAHVFATRFLDQRTERGCESDCGTTGESGPVLRCCGSAATWPRCRLSDGPVAGSIGTVDDGVRGGALDFAEGKCFGSVVVRSLRATVGWPLGFWEADLVWCSDGSLYRIACRGRHLRIRSAQTTAARSRRL